jgi:Holliday junction resolvasome RuvABC endonuclease subunit
MENQVNILALDPAVSTGYCVVQIRDNIAHIVDYGFIEEDCELEYSGDRCIALMQKVQHLITTNNITHVTIEDYFFAKRSANGCNVNAAFRTAIHIQCRMMGIDYTILNISLWKKYVAGRSTPTKEQKAKWGKEPSKKIMMQEAIWNKYKIRFPNHSISKKTGKPIKFRYDVVDAVAQAIFFCGIYLNINQVQCKISIPQDCDKIKTLFDY